MAIIYGDRSSRQLFPSSIEDYVSENDPVRAYDAILDSLDLKEVGLTIDENRVGAPAYFPLSMLKLLVYGYSYGVRSSRKLERECHHNLSFIWLLGGLKPDHKTIANFRRRNKKALRKVLLHCSKLCLNLGLIDGNVLFVDSSKFRANANMNQTWDEERCRKVLGKLKTRIDELLVSCEKVDKREDASGSGSYVNISEELKKELSDKQKLKTKVTKILKDLEPIKQQKESAENKRGKKVAQLNITDKDSVKIHGRQGTHSGYTAQMVTDEQAGLIVHNEVLSKSNDHNEFSRQIKQAEEVLGKEADVVCGDGGYCQVDDLKEVVEKGKTVVVPSRKHSSHKPLGPFDKERFCYDNANDEYICPEGNRLKFNRIVSRDNAREYLISNKNLCINCPHYGKGKCTKAKKGRSIQRKINEEIKEALDEIYESEEGQRVFDLRKQKSELPFGYIKRNIGAGYFLLRGLEGVNAEMSIFSTCFNITRMITLLGGVIELKKRLMIERQKRGRL